MKKSLSTLTLALVVLTACGTTAAPEPQPQPTVPVATPTPETVAEEEPVPPGVERNSRGSKVLVPGETEILTNDEGTELMTFTVHSIEVDPQCTGDRASAPEHGHFVVFEAEIESHYEAGEHGLNPGRTFNSAAYRVIDADGNTLGESPNTGPSHICFPESDRIPSDLGPGEKSSGRVVFDVPVDSGSLLFDIDPANGLQWEWEF